MNIRKKTPLLILSSTYPRWRGDTVPGFVHQLARRMTDEYQVHVIAPHCKGAQKREKIDGVEVHRFQYWFRKQQALAYRGGMSNNLRSNLLLSLQIAPFFLFQLLLIFRLIKKFNIQLVHAHWVIPQGLSMAIIKTVCPHIQCLITSHGADVYTMNGPLLQSIKRWAYKRVNTVTAVSKSLASDISMTYGLKEITIAPMGVDTVKQFVATKPLTGRKHFIFVGRLVDKKGVNILLLAFAKHLSAQPDSILSIVGDGPDLIKTQALAQQLSIAAKVVFYGALPNTEIPALFNEHAIAVVPSIVSSNGDQEGLGLVTIEAMACGCAVIASDLPAIRDIVSNTHNGLMFSPGDVDSLATCLTQLDTDHNLRLRLAKNGRQYVQNKFDWNRSAALYRRLYQSMTTRNKTIVK